MKKICLVFIFLLMILTPVSAQPAPAGKMSADEKTIRSEKSYPDTATMGKLDFDILEVKRLSVMYFFIAGKWHLTRSIGNIGGHFTLLFKKVKNKWMIVADHSS
ncbi:MAG TPA: hypothetical protein VK489_14150 [Ferruginibacter sp.]|nr:hypothetical protein [Ferruginibacter sp.]